MKKRFLIYQVVVPVLILFLITDCKKEEPAKLAVVSTTTVTNITQTTASAGGTVTDNGGAEITDIGVCWNTSPNPTISSNKSSIGIITGLTANTTYYLRAYATNRAGTSYGNEVTFKTDNIIIATTGPILTTTAVTSITFTSAVSGGTITNDGGEDIAYRGVCWSTSQFHLPTIEDTKTTDGTTMGYFTSNLMGLDPGTTYFVRAYATNSSGTVYGNLLSFTTSFTQGPGQGLWIQKVNLPGGVRYSAASFSIGTKGYIGIGYNDGDWPRRDFWEWDQVTNIWTRLADYPGNSTGIAVCFSIGAKGYIGTGNDFMTTGFTNEFWEYDPGTNTWTRKASLPTTPARALAVGFSIGTKGYIGIGDKNPFSDGNLLGYYQDFWEWDQATNVWTKKADFPGNTRTGAVGFSIGNKGYIATGSDGTSNSKDFWEWDQTTNVWTKKADFGGMTRNSAVGFSIGNKGYVGTGYGDGPTLYNDFWEWDQVSNVWTQNVNFGGMARNAAVGFSIGNKGYVGTGVTGINPNYAFQDFWEYDPTLK